MSMSKNKEILKGTLPNSQGVDVDYEETSDQEKADVKKHVHHETDITAETTSDRPDTWLLENEEFVIMDMFTAASLGDLVTVKELITRGEVDVNQTNHGGWSALMYAAYIGHNTVCRYLIDSGAKTESTNQKGLTPLMLAATCGNDRTCRILLENHANLYGKDKQGWTALFYATFSNHLNVVRELLVSGADPNEVDEGVQMTPFLLAAGAGHELLVDLFLQYGADINHETTQGDTARNLATLNKRLQVLMVLEAHRQSNGSQPPQPLEKISDSVQYYRPIQNLGPVAGGHNSAHVKFLDVKGSARLRGSLSGAKPDAAASPTLPVSTSTRCTNMETELSPRTKATDTTSGITEKPSSMDQILTELKLEKWRKTLQDAGVETVEQFLVLTDGDLKTAGIKPFGPRKKMLNAINRWNGVTQE